MMRLATSEHLIWRQGVAAPHGLKILRERRVRPAGGFTDPLDVLKDPHLTRREKREILSSWASDASAVQEEPALRWLLGTPEPVPLVAVQEALARLESRMPNEPGPGPRPSGGCDLEIPRPQANEESVRRIVVAALPGGWKLTIDDVANDMIFRSGREAERAARRLADRLARAGVCSEISLHLKDGTLAAKFLVPGRPRPSYAPPESHQDAKIA